jgi:phosphoenolpyruvate phosphomutase / 2-hydroxyethylphosphonate cytidylyltransferase
MKNNKIVYLTLSGEMIHHGHINLIQKAQKYGSLIVGLLTDKAITENKSLPLLNWEQRKKILQNINGVKKVIIQNEWDDAINISKIKPNFVIHGDDWKFSDKKLRSSVIKALNQYGGKLIEIPYTKNISISDIKNKIIKKTNTPLSRRNMLRRLLTVKPICRFIEAHSPLSALVAEKAQYKKNGMIREFDGFWSSSLTDSTLKGKPDIEVLDVNLRLQNINDIFDVTSKPLIMDADTGGKLEHFEINMRSIERVGVSAVIIEDKKGLKKNSLLGTSVKQEQESIKNFCKKIKIGNKACKSNDVMLFARVESLIFNKGVNDALKRAYAYLNAGASGIMIHSKETNAKEIFDFAKKFRNKIDNSIPLVVVPSTFNKVKEVEFIDNGFNIIIYANQLLRASYPSMLSVAEGILRYQRSFEQEKKIISIKEILKLIPGTI